MLEKEMSSHAFASVPSPYVEGLQASSASRSRLGAAGLLFIGVVLGSSTTDAFASTTTITEILPLEGFASTPYAVSGNGSFVFGQASGAFRWDATGGTQDLGGGGQSTLNSANTDGTVAAGYTYDPSLPGGYRAARWSASGGWQSLGGLDAGWPSYAQGVSGDGEVVVGTARTDLGGDRIFRWTSSTGMQDLGSGLGRAISNDGQIIVGQQTNRAFRRTADGTIQDLGLLGTSGNSRALAVDADGSVVVGASSTSDGSDRAFRWVDGGGMQELGSLGFSSQANGTNSDGSVVVGHSNDESGFESAFLWTQGLGMVDLRDYLSSTLGIDLTGWSLQSATSISLDGSIVAGYGTFQGTPTGWVVSGLNFNPSVIPGGGAAAMLAAGLGGLVARRRR